MVAQRFPTRCFSARLSLRRSLLYLGCGVVLCVLVMPPERRSIGLFLHQQSWSRVQEENRVDMIKNLISLCASPSPDSSRNASQKYVPPSPYIFRRESHNSASTSPNNVKYVSQKLVSANNSRSNFINSDKDLQMFKVLMNKTEVKTMMSVVDAFSAALKQANITFFLYSGSLLGSWRHHGLVPWDDDVDFVMPASLRSVAEKALNKLAPRFILSNKSIRWKFYSEHSFKIRRRGIDWRWPFLDISFYMENSSHIWDMDSKFRQFLYNKNDVFPLTLRPFQGRLLPAPQNSFAVLSRTYNVGMCQTRRYNHRFEMAINERRIVNVKCERLKHLLPFVVRTSPGNAGGCSEALRKNGIILSCCHVDQHLKDCSTVSI